MNEKEQLDAISGIKNLMERSSRFVSLSGFSGVFIGCYALAGAGAAWLNLRNNNTTYESLATSADTGVFDAFIPFFMADAILLVVVSLLTAYILTKRLTKKQGLPVWDNAAKRMLLNLLIPLFAGGLYCLILLQHGLVALIPPSLLVFYGLALLNASKYTHNDIRFMGVGEIGLGLVGLLFPGYGLLCWTLGFGILHIIYGITMYYKYER